MKKKMATNTTEHYFGVVLEHQRDVRLSDQLPHPLLPCLRPNHLPAALPQQQRPRSHEGRVSNANLHIAPDGADHRVELLSLQGGPAEGHAQVVAVDDEAERALVHVQHHGELVGNGELVVRAEPAGHRERTMSQPQDSVSEPTREQ
ncbi:hypothetical protein TYRP_006969 [Tyrophagus putrescentiae]|nr:hypothetical protein TYRP_006969 [Tyrophagus putrescentiae]